MTGIIGNISLQQWKVDNYGMKVENTRETLSKWNEKGSTKDVEIK